MWLFNVFYRISADLPLIRFSCYRFTARHNYYHTVAFFLNSSFVCFLVIYQTWTMWISQNNYGSNSLRLIFFFQVSLQIQIIWAIIILTNRFCLVRTDTFIWRSNWIRLNISFVSMIDNESNVMFFFFSSLLWYYLLIFESIQLPWILYQKKTENKKYIKIKKIVRPNGVLRSVFFVYTVSEIENWNLW